MKHSNSGNKIIDLLVLSFLGILLVALAGCRANTPEVTLPVNTPLSTPVSTGVQTSLPPSSTSLSSPLFTPSAEAFKIISELSSRSIKDVSSYRLDRSIKTRKLALNDSSTLVTSTIISKMILDLTGHNMQTFNSINVKTGQNQAEWPMVENSTCIIGDTLYIRGLFPDQMNTWSKTPATTEYWQLQNQAQLVVDMMNASKCSVSGEEVLSNGEKQAIIEIQPDLSSLWDIILAQPGIQLPEQAPAGFVFEDILTVTSTNMWINQMTGLPAKFTSNIELNVGPSQVPSLTSEISMSIQLMMSFYEYNANTSIELPEEARSAVELDLKKQGEP